MDSNRQIEARAAQWLAQRESAVWGESDQAQLNEWLEASTLNRVAYLRLEAGWEQANRLRAVGAGLPRGKVPSPADLLKNANASTLADRDYKTRRIVRSRTREPKRFAIAASILVLLGAAYLITDHLRSDRYSTPIGGLASVHLKDGSDVTLNTASQIRVRMNNHERRVDLEEGEAFFEVRRDPTRPFIVSAGIRQVVVLGTKFAVRRDDDDLRVVVVEGTVRLRGPTTKSSTFSAGSVADITLARVDVKQRAIPDSEELLSWRGGYVVFHETTLADAAAELNRYNERKIVVQDPQAASMRLSGKFRATNADAFVRLLESTSPVDVEYSADTIVLRQSNSAEQRATVP